MMSIRYSTGCSLSIVFFPRIFNILRPIFREERAAIVMLFHIIGIFFKSEVARGQIRPLKRPQGISFLTLRHVKCHMPRL